MEMEAAAAVIAVIGLGLPVLSESDSSSSSEDDRAENAALLDVYDIFVRPQKRNTIKNYCEEVIPTYSEREFISHFRINRNLMVNLANNFGESDIYQRLIAKDNTRASITPEKHMLAFLWFAGHQTASFRDVSDRFDLSLGSLHAIISRVGEFLSYMAQNVITWPTQVEKQRTMAHYHDLKGFPNIIGSIDGCHVKIDKPSERHDDYINRKSYHSMILQGICNEEKKFIDVFIGYPGSVHDARVFTNCDIYDNMNTLCEGGCLLGDSAYPLLLNLLTPYRDNGHLTAVQRNFNRIHSSCRVSIEHTFGIMKQRFRQLYHLKLRGHARITHFIRACCVLHNIADLNDMEIFMGEEGIEDDQPEVNEHGNANEADGNSLRDEIARQLFMRRR